MAENLPKDMQSLQINGTSNGSVEQTSSLVNHEDWGFPLQDLYKMALHFYKGKTFKNGLHKRKWSRNLLPVKCQK